MSAAARTARGWRLLTVEVRARGRAAVRVAQWSLAEALPALLSGLLVGAGLDRGFLVGRPLIGAAWFLAFGLAMSARAAAGRRLFPWLAELVEPLRDSLYTRVVSGTLASAVRDPVGMDGADVARLTAHVDTVRNLVSAQLRAVRQTAVDVVAATVGLAALAPGLGLFVAGAVLVAFAGFAAALPTLGRRHRCAVLATEAVAATTTPVLIGVRDVTACTAQTDALRAMDSAFAAKARAETARVRAGAIRVAAAAVGGKLPVLALLVAAPWLVRRADLTVGQVAGAVTYLTGTLDPALAALFAVIGSMGLSLNSTLRRLAESSAVTTSAADTPAMCRPVDSHLRVENITFGYGPGSAPVFAGLTLDIPPGDHLAIVGPSGAGKSTLAALLVGTLPAQRGTVYLGGEPVHQLPPGDRARHIMLIPQEAYVFAGTLRENLTYLCPGADDRQVSACVDRLGLGELVDRLANGYDAVLDTDTALSSGERQLIALARVYLSEARVVVLDEATCHLDPAAEAMAEQAFAQRGGTLVVIAHRFSSARRARRIAVVHGRTVTVDTHENLCGRSPAYARLVRYWYHADPADPLMAGHTMDVDL